jgi:hypothetical protein
MTMRIAYLTQLHHPIINVNAILTPQAIEAMAKQGHQILVIAASDREYSYHIYRNNITIIQLRSYKCPLYVGQQPVFLPFLIILQSLYRFRPDIIFMDITNFMNWIGYVYSFFSNTPTKSTKL